MSGGTQCTPVVAPNLVLPVDKRDDCMTALDKVAAKFASDQARSAGHKNTAAGLEHDAPLMPSFRTRCAHELQHPQSDQLKSPASEIEHEVSFEPSISAALGNQLSC